MLTDERATPTRAGDQFAYPVAAATKAFAGAMAVLNGGYLEPASTATGLITVGLFRRTVDNSAGANGDLTGQVDAAVAVMKNSAAADEVLLTHVGSDVYVVDDETVAATDGGATRSRAGKCVDVTNEGVWVDLHPAR